MLTTGQASLFDSLQRDEFWKRMKDGEKGDCPCCRRHAQIYKRRLHYTIAWQLITLYKLNGYADWINAVHLLMPGMHSTSDFPTARYWKLIERRPLGTGDDGKKTSGWWRLTASGMGFVLGSATITKVALVFDDKVLDFEGEEITIRDALAGRFDYSALMAA